MKPIAFHKWRFVSRVFLIFTFLIILFYSILFIKFGHDIEFSRVIEVFDGDTIMIENGEIVRYIGIDAPETIHPDKPIQCYGKEASLKNSELVLGQFVLLEKDQEDRDKYGRLLRYVYTLRYFVNAELVKEGYAYSYYYPPDLKHYKKLAELEIHAKNNLIGLWGVCSNK